MNKKIMLGVVALILVGGLMFGCGRVVNVVTPVHPASQTYGVIIGTVQDTSGNALSAVTVTAYSGSAATNAQGWFTISNISASAHYYVTFTKPGYVSTQKTVVVEVGKSSFVHVKMKLAGTAKSMDATTGGTVSVNTSFGTSAEVTIPANALVDSSGTAFTGTAQVQLTPFDPTDNNAFDAFPGWMGGYKSFGFMDISVTGSGDLNLGTGQNATVVIPVPASMTPEAAASGTCQFFYYDMTNDPASGDPWKQLGTGTYDFTREAFVGTVSHFSTWTFSKMMGKAYITGLVVDSNGDPVQGAEVKCEGDGWIWSQTTTTSGAFSRIQVATGETFQCWAEKGGRSSAVSTLGAYAEGSDNTISNIVLDAPQIQFTLAWGQDPTDLDTHLTIPSTSTTTLAAERGHLWYPYAVDKGYSNLAATYPFAILDTDDVSSYGPEVTSIYQLFEGTYRYSVHHFSGSTTISDSNASINLIVSGGGSAGIYNFTPPIGATGANDVWIVCDIVVDSSGTITEINTIGDFLHGVAAYSSEAFSPNNEPTYYGPNGSFAAQVMSTKQGK